MKKIYFFLSLACLIMFSACSSDDDQIIQETEIVPEGEKVVIGVGMPVADDTRVSTEDLQNLLWEEGDVLTCVGYSADGMQVKGTSQFSITSGFGTTAGVFEGKSIAGAALHKFIYKGKDVQFSHTMWGETTTVDYFNQVQTAPSSSASIKNSIYIETDKVDFKTFKGNLPTKIMNSVLRLNIKTLPDVIKDANKYVVDVFFDKYGDSHIAHLTYDGTIVPDAKNYLFMSIDPQLGLPSYSIMRIEITANEKTVKASYDVTNGKTYQPGKIYKLFLDYSNPGSWKWDVPVAGLTTVYEGNFTDTGAAWLEDNSKKDTDLWSFSVFSDTFLNKDFPMLKFDGSSLPLEPNEPVISRVISPAFNLKSQNFVTFTYYMKGYDFFGYETMRNNFKLWIRESNTKDWTMIPAFSTPEGWYNQGAHTPSGEITIPAEFDNKEVQISFTFYSKQYQDGADLHAGSEAGIYSLIIQGVK